jgi:phenylpropionate dioxygenase-like ring-hydroxylating dioxygenase large terminal subunit
MSEPITALNLTAKYPELSHDPVDTDMYWKEELFLEEKDKIFSRAWHCLGRIEELTEVGSFFKRQMPTFNLSVIVVRSTDNEIKAFMNACSHRGNDVELSDCGRRKAFTCKFHAWSYNLDGRLIGVPDEEGFPELDKPDIGLRQFKCSLWEGFVFVNLSSEPELTLKEYMGQQGADLEGYPFHLGTSKFQFSGVIATNWKFLVDSFCETYHIPTLHRRTINSTMAGPDNVHGRTVDIRLKGDHRTTSVWGNRKYQPKTVQGLAFKHSPGVAITSAGDDSIELPKGLNETRSPNWSIDVCVFFPGLVCVIGAGMYFTHQMWPVGAGKTHWEMTGYLRPATNAAERFGQEHTMAELRDAVLEDANTLERMQRNVSTGLVDKFYFHDHELSLRYQHYTVKKHLEAS